MLNGSTFTWHRLAISMTSLFSASALFSLLSIVGSSNPYTIKFLSLSLCSVISVTSFFVSSIVLLTISLAICLTSWLPFIPSSKTSLAGAASGRAPAKGGQRKGNKKRQNKAPIVSQSHPIHPGPQWQAPRSMTITPQAQLSPTKVSVNFWRLKLPCQRVVKIMKCLPIPSTQSYSPAIRMMI